MSEREAFLRAVAARPDDDVPRLAFADWLDEHGEHDRAEFIRVQCELEPVRDRYELPRAKELHDREDTFDEGVGVTKTWLADMPDGWDDWRAGVAVDFRRGFPDRLRCPARSFVRFGADVRGRHPTIRRVVVHCLNGWGDRLAGCDGLRDLAELELACWYADADMRALAASPYLSRLRVLVLWLGRWRAVGTDGALCRLAAAATAWPALRELVLVDPEGDREKAVKRLAASANRSAGRKLARYERGYPELFPLDANFYYDFPVAGRLPDGTAAVADLERGPHPDPHTVPTGLVVRTFGADGAPTGVAIPVPLPPELSGLKLGDANNWDGKYTRHLQRTIGFEPGFIRVQGYGLGEDFGPRRGHYDVWDRCGTADDPDDDGGDEENGIGGRIYHYVRNGEFVVGHDAWADKRGQVHST